MHFLDLLWKMSGENFNLALKYFNQASFEEKKLFYQKQKMIVFSCLEEMVRNHSTNLESVQKIYQKF